MSLASRFALVTSIGLAVVMALAGWILLSKSEELVDASVDRSLRAAARAETERSRAERCVVRGAAVRSAHRGIRVCQANRSARRRWWRWLWRGGRAHGNEDPWNTPVPAASRGRRRRCSGR